MEGAWIPSSRERSCTKNSSRKGGGYREREVSCWPAEGLVCDQGLSGQLGEASPKFLTHFETWGRVSILVEVQGWGCHPGAQKYFPIIWVPNSPRPCE
jgi:hypothetical protein